MAQRQMGASRSFEDIRLGLLEKAVSETGSDFGDILTPGASPGHHQPAVGAQAPTFLHAEKSTATSVLQTGDDDKIARTTLGEQGLQLLQPNAAALLRQRSVEARHRLREDAQRDLLRQQVRQSETRGTADSELEVQLKIREIELGERREERQLEREREERQLEREIRLREIEMQERELELQERREQREHELALTTTAATPTPGATTHDTSRAVYSEKTKLPAFDETKDELDDFLKRFERIARMQRWSQETWATRLSTCLTGKALLLYNSLTDEDAQDYEVLSTALRERFKLDAEAYRQKFRRAKAREGETSVQLLARLVLYLKRWVQMSEKTETYEDLFDLMCMEQLLNQIKGEVAVFIKEREPKSAKQIAELLRLYQRSHEGITRTSGNPPRQAPLPSVNKFSNEGTRDSFTKITGSGNGGKVKTCFYCDKPGHIKRDCRKFKKDSDSGVHCVRAGPEEEDGLSIPELCSGCARKPYQPKCHVTIDGRPGIGMRDTGADVFVVRASFVAPQAYTGETMTIALAETTCGAELPLACITVDTPVFAGCVEAVIMENPPCDLIIGNMARLSSGESVVIPVYRQPPSVAVSTRAQTERMNQPLRQLRTAASSDIDITPDSLRKDQHSDPSLAKAWTCAKTGQSTKCGKKGTSHYVVEKGILYRSYTDGSDTFQQVLVPQRLRTVVMRTGHETILAGHMAAKRTLDRIWRHFYWPGMCSEIRRFCQSCDQCQRTTPKGRVKKVPLQAMPLIDEPFRRIAVDIVGPIIPASEDGNRFILTMVDYATRYPEAIALKSIEATRVAEALVTMWSRLGIPAEILTDRGTQFTSAVMAEVERLMSIKHNFTTPYHAQCNGLVERFNGTLKTMLKRLCQEKPRTWDRYIPALLFAYREVPQESLGFSPFELLYGRRVRGPMSILRQAWTDDRAPEEVQTTATYVVELRNRIHETCQIAQESLRKAAGRYAETFNRKAKPRYFRIGQRVLLLLPLRHNKLQLQWQGPYEITARVGEVDYRIKVGDHERLYHANLLRLYHEREPNRPSTAADPPPPTTDDSEEDDNTADDPVISVVMEEEEEIDFPTRNVPTLPLKQKETFKDVKIAAELDQEQREQVETELRRRSRILTDVPLVTDLATFRFTLLQAEPVRCKSYPMPFAHREVISKEVDDMLRIGVIEPACSPYNAPIVLVKKPDGSIRFCTDYRRLNRVTEFDAEPMPDTDYLFSRISKAKYFSKVDLAKGYWQIPVAKEDRPKTAFTTPKGQFQWKVMPFGLQNAGAVFTRMMRRLLDPLDLEDVSNFIDDILIATDTWERHMFVLRKVFRRLEEANLAARPSKCFIGFSELAFLGHIVGNGQVRLEENKVEKIRSAARPTTKKEVRAFLGLASYYRKFIPHFAAIALPLTDMTKKKEPTIVIWTDAAESAFQTLKERLTNDPILRLPDLEKDFVLRTDASGLGLGAMLMQTTDGELHPVYYASRKLSSAENKYATVERECLAIVWAVGKFEVYLYGRRFVLQTDHQPLQYLQKARQTNARLTRWALLLQPFIFTIQVIPGKDNVGADYLSRVTY